jgi:hypothetical protein
MKSSKDDYNKGDKNGDRRPSGSKSHTRDISFYNNDAVVKGTADAA